jgi:hypothetical protein
MFCPAGASQQCRCPVDSYQDGARSSACKQCIGQADLVTGLNVCATDSAEEERFKNVCFCVIGVFATISLCYFVLTILLWRSRHLSQFGTNHTTACFYTTSFAVYALLKVFASHRMLQALTQQEKLTAGLIMSCTFMLFFWMVVVGKMWLVQLWTLLLSDHVKADSRQAFMLTAHCAQIIERRIALAVCAVYCIGFASFAGVFSAALGACAAYADSSICIPFSSGNMLPACNRASFLARGITYYEGSLTAVVVVVFSFYSTLFNSMACAPFTSDVTNSNAAKLQRLLIASKFARWMMKPYVLHCCFSFYSEFT